MSFVWLAATAFFLIVPALPGFLAVRGRKELPWATRIAVGYALSIVLLYACAQVSVAWWAAALPVLMLLGFWLPRRRRGFVEAPVDRSPGWRPMLGLAGGYFLFRLVPALVNDLPVGWDPYFHLVLAQRIAETHRILRSWLPFEDIPLNYPQGPHLLLGTLSWLAQVPVHFSFKVAIIWFTALTGLQIFSVLREATGKPQLALYGAASYLFLADYGSFGYAIWGGLPNLMGMSLLLGLIGLLLTEAARRSRGPEIAIFALLFLGISFTHHHSMATAGLVLAWVFWRVPSLRSLICKGALAAALVGSPYYVPYLLRAASLSSSGIAAFNEPAMSVRDITSSFSPPFFFACLLGVLIFWRRRKALNLTVAPALLAALSGFLVCFIIGDYLIRVVTVILYYKQAAPFTPSRFLTDAVMLLSLFAGICFWQLAAWLELSPRWTLALIMAGFAYLLPLYRDSFAEMVPRNARAAYAWIRANSRADAWVLDGGEIHASYLTDRASSGLPIPTSEFKGEGHYHAAMLALEHGESPELARGREVFAVVRDEAAPPTGYREVWAGERIKIYERAPFPSSGP